MSAITLVLNLEDKATPALLKAAHAAKSLAAQEKAVGGLQEELRRVAKEADRIRVGPEQFQINEAIKDLDRLEAKLRATNTLTDSALSTITTRRSQLTSKAADTTARSLDGLGNRAHHMGEAFGDADSALVGFSSVLDLVNPKLGAAVRVAADVGASLEGMIRVVRVGLPIVAALGAAAAVGAVAYSRWADKSERLKKNLEASSAAMEAQKSMVEKIRDAQLDLAVALDDISESEAEIKRIRREAFIESLPAVQELTKQITAQQEATTKAAKAMKDAKDIAEVGAFDVAGGRMEGGAGGGVSLEVNAARAAKVWEKEDIALGKLVDKRIELVAQTNKLVEVQIATTEARNASTISEDKAKEAADRQNAELERMIGNLDSLSGSISELLPEQALNRIEQLDSAREMIAALTGELDRLSGELSETDRSRFEGLIAQYQAALEKATADFMGDPVELDITPKIDTEEWIRQQKELERTAQSQAGVAQATGAIGAAMDPMGAVAATGPIGALIAAVVSALQKLGERDPETGQLAIKERAKGFVLAIESGIRALPGLLQNFVPWFVDFLVRKLIPAMIESGIKSLEGGVPKLITSLILMVAQWIVDLVRAIGTMLKQFWRWISGQSEGGLRERGAEAAAASMGDTSTRGNNRSADRARSAAVLIDSPGMGRNGFRQPLLSVMRRQTTTGGESGSAVLGGSGGVVVNISGSLVDRNVVDRLGRELNRQFGSYGRSTQPIFSS